MPMKDPFIEVYEEVMKPTVEAAGHNYLYAGDMFVPKMIVEDLWEHIERAAVVIADLTGRNANVFYEVGYTHSLLKARVLSNGSIVSQPAVPRPKGDASVFLLHMRDGTGGTQAHLRATEWYGLR